MFPFITHMIANVINKKSGLKSEKRWNLEKQPKKGPVE